MHGSRLLIPVAFVSLTQAIGLSTARADLTVSALALLTDARGAPTSSDFIEIRAISNPFSATSHATDNGSSSTSAYDFAFGATGGSFGWDMTQTLNGNLSSYAWSGGGLNLIVTDTNIRYDFSGSLSMTGGQWIGAGISLYDPHTAGGTLFDWRQTSHSTPDESFVVGQLGGDFASSLIGSSSGMLLAGHEYTLLYDFGIQNQFDGFGATAVGGFHFATAAVPVPGAVLLGTLGLGMVGCVRRWPAGSSRPQGACVESDRVGPPSTSP